MSNNFELSDKLRLYFSIAAGMRHPYLGFRFPVSIRKRYSFSQKMVIYPESGHQLFTSREVMYFLSLADSLELVPFVSSENGVPVIEISDFNFNDD